MELREAEKDGVQQRLACTGDGWASACVFPGVGDVSRVGVGEPSLSRSTKPPVPPLLCFLEIV